MTNTEKMLKFVPVLPAKIRLSVLREKTGMTVQEILTLARKFEFTVNTTLNDPTIAQKGGTSEILIYKNEFPYKAVKGLTEASELTKVPKTTILSMILAKLTKKKDKENGGCTTPDGWGFDYLA
jgi:hypothetical protein